MPAQLDRDGSAVPPSRISVLAGGIGGARFLRGLLAQVGPETEVTVIGNTGDDIWLHGLRICPDLDTVMYTLGGGISEERGWGREDETFTVKDELAAYGVEPSWFGLGDRDIGTHLVRTQMLNAGYPLSAVTEALCTRWQPGVRLIPMTDDRAETHVIVEDPARRALHFQEWWVRYRAEIPAREIVLVGAEDAKPAPGVTEAIEAADIVLLPPSNPVVSVGTILQVPGIRESLLATAAPVIGVSPIVGGRPVRGMADACLAAIGVETSALAVAAHYGARGSGGILDGWLVDSGDADAVGAVEALGIPCRARPLLMTDLPATSAIAAEALDLGVR
ncbi:MAG: 2-phospho-L-lactate transferase [Candidatus Nanopelagicales bacterium]